MYEEKIIISVEVCKRFRKKMNELREYYSDMDVNFELSSRPGDLYLKITSKRSDDFNLAVREIKQHINKFNNDYERRLKYKKIEKEKNERKRIKAAERKIKKNIKHLEDTKDEKEIINNEIQDISLRNNMFYGLEIDVPCP